MSQMESYAKSIGLGNAIRSFISAGRDCIAGRVVSRSDPAFERLRESLNDVLLCAGKTREEDRPLIVKAMADSFLEYSVATKRAQG